MAKPSVIIGTPHEEQVIPGINSLADPVLDRHLLCSGAMQLLLLQSGETASFLKKEKLQLTVDLKKFSVNISDPALLLLP